MEDGWDPGDPSQVATFAKDEDRAGQGRRESSTPCQVRAHVLCSWDRNHLQNGALQERLASAMGARRDQTGP